MKDKLIYKYFKFTSGYEILIEIIKTIWKYHTTHCMMIQLYVATMILGMVVTRMYKNNIGQLSNKLWLGLCDIGNEFWLIG